MDESANLIRRHTIHILVLNVLLIKGLAYSMIVLCIFLKMQQKSYALHVFLV